MKSIRETATAIVFEEKFMSGVTGVILAGGESRRFGSVKVLAKTSSGKTVIELIVDALLNSNSVGEVLVSVSNIELGEKLKTTLGLNYVIDVVDKVKGPQAGMLSVMKTLGINTKILFLPGDIPWVTSRFIEAFIERAQASNAIVSSPLWGNGVIEPLISYVYVREELIKTFHDSVFFKRTCRPTDLHRSASRLVLIGVSLLTSNLYELSDVNVPEDLTSPKVKFSGSRDLLVLEENSSLFREAINMLRSGDSTRASLMFKDEGEVYEKAKAYHLAYQAYLDALIYGMGEVEAKVNNIRKVMGIGRFHTR